MAPGPGATQVILADEPEAAGRGIDDQGRAGPVDIHDATASLFVEHGLTDRLTLQAKLAWTAGHDSVAKFDGRGPTELGLRYAVWRRGRSIASTAVAVIAPGVGRNAGYDAPHRGSGDVELRFLAGSSFRFGPGEAFAEGQVTRFFRSGLPNETRIDATFGQGVGSDWLVMLKTYSGVAERSPAPYWVKGELCVVRRLSRWSVQAGWRSTLLAHGAPLAQGPVIALWRRF